ncbi:GNAT family N-acetyltransferase [Actinomyces timonensis]|uniref:GNAT family N-acetyltransferase n=1 Tax=Actinomyces timonensis TaxID=1288391 RepID=UPI0002FE2A7D|nr:GNAT family N-acetyltransferase [Actinomyces timonensis]
MRTEPAEPPACPPARLREMRADDLDVVAALEAELFGGEAWSPALLGAELAASQGEGADRRYVVVESENAEGEGAHDSDGADGAGGAGGADGGRAILGYAGLWFGDGRGDADLLTIATAARARRRGLARLMLDHLIAQAREAGCGAILLEVRASNEPAQALYLARGFEPIGRRRRYYSAPTEDAVVMRLALPGTARASGVGPVGSEAV